MTAGPGRGSRAARRALGAVLLALALLPFHRLLEETADEGSFRAASLRAAEVNLPLAWWGTVVTVLAGAALAWILPASGLRRLAVRFSSILRRPSLASLGLGSAILGGGLSFLVWTLVHRERYTIVDEIASMVHARYLASGLLAGRLPATPAAWVFPNTLLVDEGWVSQYPPSHLAVMALLARLGIPGLLGPLCVAATALLAVLSLPRILPDRPTEARLAAILFAVSPFVLWLGGGALSHLTAGAFLMSALYAALRARDGNAGWAVLAGAAVGLAVLSRPLQGLVLGTLFTLGVWIPAGRALRASGVLRRSLATVAGGLPFAGALGWFNRRLFGDPLTLGYSAAYGDRHGLGFHMDPWGSRYGPLEALGFTSADFLEIGLRFLETPIPLTVVVALYLLTSRRVPRGMGFLVAWATLPLLSNAAYWFHSLRMMYETTPAWLALGVLGVVDLAGRRGADASAPEPVGGDAADSGPHPASSRLRRWMRDTVAWSAVTATAVALVWGMPQVVEAHRWTDETLSRITGPALPEAGPGGTLVFVHAGWSERISAVLQGEAGMRSDTIVSVLRRNPTCRVHEYAQARAAGSGGPLPVLDLRQEPGMAPGVERRPVQGMDLTVRVRQSEELTPACARELLADRFGTVSLAPLILEGELPGIETGTGALYVRDLGPGRNREVMRAYPERTPYLFAADAPGARPRAMPYAEGEALLWGVGPSSEPPEGN